MTDTALDRDLTEERARLKERVCVSFTARDFRAGVAPLCRLLLLETRGPERAVLLSLLALAHAQSGRRANAERALRDARRLATEARGRAAVRLVGDVLGLSSGTEASRT